MQVVEDMEEDILCLFFSGKVMDIIDDQHIDHLVEMDEIVLVVVPYRVDELVDELVGGDIKTVFSGKLVFHLESDGMGQMGFPKARIAVKQQWVEGGFPGVAGNGKTCGTCQPVAVAFNKIFKGITLDQLGVDLDLFQSRDDKRIRDLFGCAAVQVNGHGYGRVCGCFFLGCRNVDGIRSGFRF